MKFEINGYRLIRLGTLRLVECVLLTNNTYLSPAHGREFLPWSAVANAVEP